MAFKSTNEGQQETDDYEFPAWTPDKEQEAQEIAAANQLPPPPSEFLKFEPYKVLFVRVMPPKSGELWVDDIGHLFKHPTTKKFMRFACPAHERGERCAACEKAAMLNKHAKWGSAERDEGNNLMLQQQKTTLAVDLNNPSAGVRKLTAKPRMTKGGGLFELFKKLSDAGIGYWLAEGKDKSAGLVLPIIKTGADMQISYDLKVPLSRLPGVSLRDIGKFKYELKTNEANLPIVVATQVQPQGIRTPREWADDYFDLSAAKYVPTYAETKAYVDGTALPEQRTMQTEMNAARGPTPDLSEFED